MSLQLEILLHLYTYVSQHYFVMIRAGIFDLFTVLLKLIASDVDRSGASSLESFFPQSNETFELRDISETSVFFFRYGLYNKEMFLFDHIIDIRDEPARPGRNAL